MAASRRIHATKSTEEKREYRENVIRPQPAPTMDLLPSSDSTATTATVETPTTRSDTPTAHSPAAKGWLHENLSELGYATLALGFLAWLGLQMFGLNREVGELKQRVEAIEKARADGAATESATEQRMQREIDRLA